MVAPRGTTGGPVRCDVMRVSSVLQGGVLNTGPVKIVEGDTGSKGWRCMCLATPGPHRSRPYATEAH